MAKETNRYQVELRGVTPLLMHHDDVAWADQMQAWLKEGQNKKNSRAGDDRYPAHRWMGCLYRDAARGVVAIPQDMVMAVLREGGKGVATGQGRATYSRATQSGAMPEGEYWDFEGPMGQVPTAEIEALQKHGEFAKHAEAVRHYGFTLYMKRARVGQGKHVRIRPRFDQWLVRGVLVVHDSTLTQAVLQRVLDHAGKYVGMGDWRPGGKTPGPFGTFTAKVSKA